MYDTRIGLRKERKRERKEKIVFVLARIILFLGLAFLFFCPIVYLFFFIYTKQVLTFWIGLQFLWLFILCWGLLFNVLSSFR